jgi:hypothetical protein
VHSTGLCHLSVLSVYLEWRNRHSIKVEGFVERGMDSGV